MYYYILDFYTALPNKGSEQLTARDKLTEVEQNLKKKKASKNDTPD